MSTEHEPASKIRRGEQPQRSEVESEIYDSIVRDAMLWRKQQMASGAASRRPAVVGGTAAVATSEPQEQDLKLLAIDCCQIVHGSSTNAEAADAIYERITAAIAAERKKTTEAKRYAHNCNLLSVELEQQLLTAQSAIKEARQNKNWDDIYEILDNADESALEQHDAEVIEKDRFNRRDVLGWEQGYKCAKAEAAEARKPLATANLRLMGALQKARETIHALHGDVTWEIYEKHSPEMKQIDAALAQAKEQP